MGEHIAGDNELRQLTVVVFPLEYLGPVYATLISPGKPLEVDVTLRWGPWTYERLVTVDSPGVSLLFSKTQAGEGQPPLRVATSEPLAIGIYTGVPDGPALDCNEGWRQS